MADELDRALRCVELCECVLENRDTVRHMCSDEAIDRLESDGLVRYVNTRPAGDLASLERVERTLDRRLYHHRRMVEWAKVLVPSLLGSLVGGLFAVAAAFIALGD